MYSFSYLEPVCCSMSSFNCCFLTCKQVSQEAGQVVWYSHLLKNFPQFIVIHTVKCFGIVNKAEIDIFLELSSFFDDPEDVGNLISGSSAFSKTSLNIWKFMVHVLLKPGLENFEHYFTSMWDECNCVVVWAFFGIAFLWDWNENSNGTIKNWAWLSNWTTPTTWQRCTCAVIGNNPSTQLGFYVELALTVAFKMFSMCLIQPRSNISKGKFYSCHGNREGEIDFKESRCQKKKKKNQSV